MSTNKLLQVIAIVGVFAGALTRLTDYLMKAIAATAGENITTDMLRAQATELENIVKSFEARLEQPEPKVDEQHTL